MFTAKDKQRSLNDAVQKYLKLSSIMKRRRLSEKSLHAILQAVNAPWMTPKMIYSEVARRRRRVRSHLREDELPEQEEKIVFNIPSDIPLTVAVDEDERSEVSNISGEFKYDSERSDIDKDSSTLGSFEKEVVSACVKVLVEEGQMSDHDYAIRLDKAKQTVLFKYKTTLMEYRKVGMRVPRDLLQEIISESIFKHRLPGDAKAKIEAQVENIRRRARKELKELEMEKVVVKENEVQELPAKLPVWQDGVC